MTRAGGDERFGATEQGTVAVLTNRVLDLVVEADPAQVTAARHAVVEHLSRNGVSSVAVDDLELVASELITNAVVHPPVSSDAVVLVHVEVADSVAMTVANVGWADRIPPVDTWLPAAPDAVSGRGLGIVRRLCDEVAVEQRGELTVVRCRCRL